MSQKARHTIATKIGDQYTQERITSTKKREYIKHRVLKNHITSDNYEDSDIVDVRLFKSVIYEIINKHASNAIHYKILACIEPDSWHEIKSETQLNADSKTYEWSEAPWCYVKIQVKSASAGSSGKVDAYIGERG